MSVVNAPPQFWSCSTEKPSISSWDRWRKTFVDYLELLPILNPLASLTEHHKIKLLRQLLGDEGQRYFDALRIDDVCSTATDALNAFSALWGIRQNVFTARYFFFKLCQKPEENVNEFIARILQATPDCRYNEIDPMKFEETMRLQCLIAGISDQNTREKLLSQDDGTLGWEIACSIARQRESLTQQLSTFNLQTPPEDVQLIKKTPCLAGTFVGVKPFVCYRCGDQHRCASECQHQKTVCGNCGKVGHLARVCRSIKHRSELRKSKATAIRVVDNCEESEPELHSVWLNTVSNLRPVPYTVELYIQGQKVPMEIDTGASVTIIRADAVKDLPPLTSCTSNLRTYTGEPIRVLGKCLVEAQYGEKTHKLPVYVIAGNRPNLLGRDWIHAFPNTLDVLKMVNEVVGLEEILKQHSESFAEELGKLKGFQATIRLKEGAVPKFIKARTLPYAVRPKVEEELNRLQSQGIIVPVQFSDWGTPIVPVAKPDGSVRICGDYKTTINQSSMIVRYPLPRIEDLYATLAGGEKFTKLDLSHAYSQLELDEPSRELTTISTHMGLYQYTRLPFGINSAPGIFQRIIDDLVKDIPFTCAYLDDILISGRSDAEHLQTLSVVLNRLARSGLRLKKSKCEFMSSSVCYLGYRLDRTGLHVLADKIKPILESPEPRNSDELRSFLGMLSHYRRFLPNASTVLASLNELLHKNVPWCWGSRQRDAFAKAKQALVSSPMLVHFDPRKPLILQCDASPWGVGAVLCHRMNGDSIRPIAFASRTLQSAEKSYSQLDKEALSVIFGVKRFHQYLWGNFFELHTDHKPLIALLGESKGIQQMSSPRMQRWALTLSAYNYKITYISGANNRTADALSRLPVAEKSPEPALPCELVHLMQHLDTTPLRSSTIRHWTDRDPVLSTVKRFLTVGWPSEGAADLQPFVARRNELSLFEGCVFWGSRLVPPRKARAQILQELHDAHPGVARMKALARGYCWWPGIDTDIENMLKNCGTCQAHQRSKTPGPVHPWRWPDKPWQRIHADYFGPIYGTMFLLLIDAHSKWIEVYPVTHATSETTISKMRSSFATFGIPETVCTDNGSPFVSAEFNQFVTKNGIQHIKSAPYHPASNGLAERAVQTVKRGLLKQRVAPLQTKLDRFLFAYRSTPTESTGKSPAELMFGRNLRTRLHLLFPNPRTGIEERQKKLVSSEKLKRDHIFRESDLVYTRLPHETQWQPATIIGSSGSQNDVQLQDGRVVRRHSDHVRPRNLNGSAEIQIDVYTDKEQITENEQDKQRSESALRRSTRISKPIDRFQPGL